MDEMSLINDVFAAPMSGQSHAVAVAVSRWANVVAAPDYNRAVLVVAPDARPTLADLDAFLSEAADVPGDMHAETSAELVQEQVETREAFDDTQRDVLGRLPD
jgi:hypothetical protein